MLPRVRLPHAILMIALAIGLLMSYGNIRKVIDHPDDVGSWAAVRSDVRALVTIAVVAVLIWLSLELGRRWLREMEARQDKRLDNLSLRVEEIGAAVVRLTVDRADTVPIPRPHLRIVGTAVVAPAAAPVKVIDEPAVATGLTPDIIAAGRRISERLARRDDD
jgi:hypothetical protein